LGALQESVVLLGDRLQEIIRMAHKPWPVGRPPTKAFAPFDRLPLQVWLLGDRLKREGRIVTLMTLSMFVERNENDPNDPKT
jgi:hypothetical protein